MNVIRIRSISNGVLVTLVICVCCYIFLPLCTICMSEEGFSMDHLNREARLIIVIILIFACIPLLALLAYICFHYLKHAIVSPSGVQMKIPMHKEVTISREQVTAFGIAHFGPRDTKLYFCYAPSETILTFFESHLDDCKRLFRNLPYEEYRKTQEGQWQMAVGIYVYFKQAGVYILENGNRDNINQIEELIREKPINIDICARFP